jgi:phospholipase/carboxylesterase
MCRYGASHGVQPPTFCARVRCAEVRRRSAVLCALRTWDIRSLREDKGLSALPERAGTTVHWRGTGDVDAPLIVLLHGWGETEVDMVALVPSLPINLAYASIRAPYGEGPNREWFVAGRPFVDTMRWFESWLDAVAPVERPVVLVGFSAGAAFAGGVLLLHPERYVGAAMLCGTLPFDAGVSTPSGRLVGTDVFVAHRSEDATIPRELLDRAWTYLTQHSGARAHAVRYEGRHGASPVMLADLAMWLSHVVEPTERESM